MVDSPYGYIGMNHDFTGTVTVSGAGSIWRNTYSVYVGNNGAGALTIADGGTVNADFGLQVAEDSGSTGTLNIGAAATDPAAAAGILDADTLAFGAGAGTLVFNHTDSDYDFATAISGPGTITISPATRSSAPTAPASPAHYVPAAPSASTARSAAASPSMAARSADRARSTAPSASPTARSPPATAPAR